MHARTTAIFQFSTRNFVFRQIWTKIIKIVGLSWNVVQKNISNVVEKFEYAEFNGDVDFFVLDR